MKNALLATLLLLTLPLALLSAQTPPPMHIALLIDDGPTPDQLEKFLALFKREQIHATFSFVAKNVEAHPQLAKAAAIAGHEVANHSYEHLHPAGLSEKALNHEVIDALKILKKQADIHPAWYWPPFVEITPELEKTVAKTDMKLFRPTHLVASGDYMTEIGAGEIHKRALAGVNDGTVILFHEWRKETLEQMPNIIADLKKQGAVFMTISELTNYLNSAKPSASVQPPQGKP